MLVLLRALAIYGFTTTTPGLKREKSTEEHSEVAQVENYESSRFSGACCGVREEVDSEAE